MNQIIIEHYKNSCNFISLEDFKIPFTIDDGLYFNKEIVYKNGLEKGILINEKLNASNSRVAIKEGIWIYYYENETKESEGNFKNGIREGFWIFWDENGQEKSKGNYKYENKEGFWISCDENGNKNSEENYKNGKLNARNSRVAIEEGLWIF